MLHPAHSTTRIIQGRRGGGLFEIFNLTFSIILEIKNRTRSPYKTTLVRLSVSVLLVDHIAVVRGKLILPMGLKKFLNNPGNVTTVSDCLCHGLS